MTPAKPTILRRRLSVQIGIWFGSLLIFSSSYLSSICCYPLKLPRILRLYGQNSNNLSPFPVIYSSEDTYLFYLTVIAVVNERNLAVSYTSTYLLAFVSLTPFFVCLALTCPAHPSPACTHPDGSN